jgi:hypothetical protein
LVAGVPYQVRLDFDEWRKPIKLGIRYIGEWKKGDLTVKGSFKDNSHSVEVNGKPEKVQIMPPVNKYKPEDVIFYLQFESSSGISFVVQPAYDSSWISPILDLEEEKVGKYKSVEDWQKDKEFKIKKRGA